MDNFAIFAAYGLALYVGHHVGDYWVQTDHQAQHKGDAGHEGRWACAKHCLTYGLTQFILAATIGLTLAPGFPAWRVLAGVLVSVVTHYAADRREHGLMFRLARLIPGKADFLKLGVPRTGRDDNPSLGTGAWALDQSWHLFFGVFIPALLIAL
jgi:Protein of unknown function (DUF3307)